MVAPCDVLAIGAHPDDAELGCGATLARVAAGGRRVAILDLTAGELSTRGTPAERAAEAAAAATALGAAWRQCLGLPDCGLRGGDDGQRAALAAVLRAARPRAVLLHDASDPHPDHREAARLTAAACFLAGVPRYGPAAGAGRPALLLAYPGPRQLLTPAVVVDVTGAYAAKRAALACHASQFDPTRDGAATHLASGHFIAAVEGRDRAAGGLVGAELGEGFAAVGPIPAGELAWLLGGSKCG